MKISLNWLREYVDIEMPPDELGHLLTMTGLEVEGLEPVAESLDRVVVGKITSVRPHPNADRLALCQVDAGREEIQVVCGAPNVAVGAVSPLALPGARLPNDTVMKEGRVRGEASYGMLLAEDELGLTDDHTGIMILSEDLSPGASISSALNLPDWVFDVGITPNRPDCASVIGIAREIAAATGKKLNRPVSKLEQGVSVVEDFTSVTILDPAGCPRYVAGIVQDIELKPSPFWMRYRLYQSGIRSINNLVDVTNYVMLELGQPLHAFDYDRLGENRIVVRRADEGEVFTTLDGETRTLGRETLMICDGERAVALAGIMGGLNSEIFAGTRRVLVESAFFDPVTIRRASKGLGLSTEASYRFERGADIGGVAMALSRAVFLISKLAGGMVVNGFVDNYPKVHTPPVIRFRVDKTNRILGTSVSKDLMTGYLKALEMEVHDLGEGELQVKPPSFRVDITREVDLMEEVARLDGFDKIPATYPIVRPSEKKDSSELFLRDRIRSVMPGLGFTEIITYSFVSPESADILGAEKESDLRLFTKLLNPLTVDESVLRTSLIPGLMATVKANMLHDETDLKLFEWGKVFIQKEKDQLPLEKIWLAALMTGHFSRKSWYGSVRQVDFYDIKGAAEALLKSLGVEDMRFEREDGFPGYDNEVSAGIYRLERLIGHVGRVSPTLIGSYDLKMDEAYLFELDINALAAVLDGTRQYRPFARFPAVFRDISLLVGRQIDSAKVITIINREGGELVESVRIFDLYEGGRLDPSEKAIAFRICYRSAHETLDGEKMNRLHESIIDRIREETGGRLREG